MGYKEQKKKKIFKKKNHPSPKEKKTTKNPTTHKKKTKQQQQQKKTKHRAKWFITVRVIHTKKTDSRLISLKEATIIRKTRSKRFL